MQHYTDPITGGTKMTYLSADRQPVEVGRKFWDNNLRVVQVTALAVSSNKYSDTGEIQTWHDATPGGWTDTLSGSMQPYGRVARYFEGRDAERYEPGTNYADVK